MEDEIYDRNGFFFQQRSGHLNLRRFEALDLQRLVREVDIETLQENIEEITFTKFSEQDLRFFTDKQVVKLFQTAQLIIEYLLFSQEKLVNNLHAMAKKYTSKKRSLHEKRKELASLREETSSLHQQIKSKRRNLATLEKLVREAQDQREEEDRTAQYTKKKAPTVPFVKFYITFPDGVYVELEELKETSIRHLLQVVRNALAGQKHPLQEGINDNTKLFLRGKILLLDSTLVQCGVQDGDTIIVNNMQSYDSNTHMAESKHETAEAVAMQQKMLQAVELQLKSIEQLTAEIKKGIEVDVKGYVQEKLSEEVHKISEAVSLLQQQSNSQPKTINQPRLISGELEGDIEDPLAALQEVNLRLLQSNSRFMSLDSHLHQTNSSVGELKDLLLSQQYQLEDLRSSLNKMPAPIVTVVEAPKSPRKVEIVREIMPTPQAQQVVAAPAPVVIEAPAPVVTIVQEEKPIEVKPTVVAKKHEMKPLFTAEPLIQQKREEVIITPVAVASGHDLPDVFIDPKKQKKDIVTAAPKEVVEVEEIMEFKPKQTTHDPPPKPANVLTRFPSSFFTGHVPPYAKDVTVELEPDLSVVDVVFEMRKVIATQLKLPFKTICLILDHRLVKLGVDVDEDVPFTAQDTVEYARSGRLSVMFERTQLVANDHIDRLAPVWAAAAEAKAAAQQGQENKLQRDDLKASQHSNRALTKQMSGSFAARRKYEDEDVYGEDEKKRGFKASYSSTRSSFEQLMNDLSERRSLTDDELTAKRKELDAASNSDSDGQRAYRASLTHAMGALAAESGSESANDDFFRQSVRLSRQDWTTTMMPDFLSLRSSSTKQGGGVVETLNLRQSTAASSRSRRAREAEEWEQEDSLPMMSSLNGPLRYGNDGNDRYDENEHEQQYNHDSMMDDDDMHHHGGSAVDTKQDTKPSAAPATATAPAPAATAASQPKALPQQQEQPAERQFKMPKNADSSPQKRVTLPPQQQKSSSVEDCEELYETIPLASQSSSQWNNSRYVEEPTPSFISSVGRDSHETNITSKDDTISALVPGGPGQAGTSTAEGLYLGNTGGTTSGSSAMSTMGFSSTLESSGEINKFDTMEIRQAADRYEHDREGSHVMAFDNTAGEISALEMTMNTEDGDISKASSDSPFRDFRGRGGERGTGTLTTVSELQSHDLDTMSTHSLAISAVSD